jgi:phosphoribosylformylglycinamidine cyclo-ligase
MSEPTSAYAAAGVDIEAGDRAVELMKAHVARTRRPEVLGGLGGFAGFFDASAFKNYDHPVLATSTDGVGTKVAIAQALDRHDTIGFDLIGMLVDDLVVVGAEPLFVTDYIATGKVVPERIAAIVSGIAAACEVAGAALLGGETAEHPGLLDPDEYDIAGATTGVVERSAILGPERVRCPATSWSRWPPRACTRMATRWCGMCCWSGPAGRWIVTSRSWGRRWGRPC